jgi:alpha-tubulin suppressor-like RCC1 family protein
MARAQRKPPRVDRLAGLLVLALGLAGLSCSDEPSTPGRPVEQLPLGLVVSEPIPISGNGGVAETRVYVSASPGTFANGDSVTLANLASGGYTESSIADGGFDPQAIEGSPDDELEIVVIDGDGTRTIIQTPVPTRRSPSVVRTWPRDGWSDVAINGTVGAVFGEPMDESTIGPETFRLLQAGASVAGTVSLGGDRLRAQFVPTQPLAPESSYALLISTGVADLSGDFLEATVEARFSTAAPPEPFLASMVSVGFGHTCAITSEGRAYCWGRNSFGQLGTDSGAEKCYADEPCSSHPLPVAGDLTFVSISASSSHTCGVTTGSVAYCWGRNRYGQLGDGSTIDREAPVPVSGGLEFVSITAGSWHTCGLTIDGYAYCWGLDSHGALGIDQSTTETCADADGEDRPCSTRPLSTTGGLIFTSVSAASHHTCGIAAGGLAYCWGDNADGQLGIGTFENSIPRVPLRVTGGLTLASIAAGGKHSCGITTGGEAYCWGENTTGSLGTGTTSTATPMPVSGGHEFDWVDPGAGHSCGVTSEGQAFCWGQGIYGVLGDGSAEVHIERLPVPVLADLNFASISAYGHSCGITEGGEVYCWGGNHYGAVGDGTTIDRAMPVSVIHPP